MRINKKLTSINEKQESTIKALKEVKKNKIKNTCTADEAPIALQIDFL